ncbi:UNVERIFIED_CONTAM: F-box/kelch-repeat protein [Sesamum radiatum]|uniref:F-box/kelch-repeat protein n=1 Tax=Sesamum radiatum TaxID=300843 RepID=A0AAW2QIT9_SESRA
MARGNSTKGALTTVVDCLTGGLSVPLPNLPEEIITEILLRLPVKALLRFRCVTKSWLSLISTPQFIKTHLRISSKSNIYSHNRLVVGSGPLPMVFNTFSLCPNIDHENSSMDNLVFDYPTSDTDDLIRIVGSCNGLVCVAVYPNTVVLWNPATRKSRKLPVSDRYLSDLEYGFGYDASSDDYKVVESGWVFRDPGVYETQVMVYSWRADTWRTVDWPAGKILDGPGVFVDGAIHWKVYHGGRPSNCVVVAQNVTTETCSILELPACGSDGGNVMLGVSGGCLCASYDYYSYMDVWMLKESGRKESWTKLVCVPYFFCMRHYDHVRPKLLFVSENGGVLLSLGSDLIMYKPSQYHEIHRLGNHVEVEAATYSESLLSPDFDPELVWE